MRGHSAIDLGDILAVLTIAIFGFGPWITHIVWCIRMANETGSAIALLIVGMVAFPIGWLHGVSLWFGFTWI